MNANRLLDIGAPPPAIENDGFWHLNENARLPAGRIGNKNP
jgi:hypothetical protein